MTGKDKSPGRTDFTIIMIAILLVSAIIVVGYTLTLSNEPGETPPGQIGAHNITYEANATFILPSGNASFRCEVADTPTERQTGLMNRQYLDNGTGMLFVFDSPVSVSFWMKDTLIPLDIVFINETGHVVNIARADPEPGVPDTQLTRYSSQGPVLWVLELNQGACARDGIVPGTPVEISH